MNGCEDVFGDLVYMESFMLSHHPRNGVEEHQAVDADGIETQKAGGFDHDRTASTIAGKKNRITGMENQPSFDLPNAVLVLYVPAFPLRIPGEPTNEAPICLFDRPLPRLSWQFLTFVGVGLRLIAAAAA